MANNLNMTKYLRKLKSEQPRLMRRLGNESKTFFQVNNWEAQGFIDNSVNRWESVKGKKAGQKILVVTGRLRRSARSFLMSFKRARVEFNTTYASYVNKDRPFVGNSRALDKRNYKIITNFMAKIFSKY